MEQLRPLDPSIQTTGFDPNLSNEQLATILTQQSIPKPTPTIKEVDMNDLTEPTSKMKIELFSDDINTDFIKTKTADAKPEADNRNTTYINPGPVQPNTGLGYNGSTPLIKSKEDLRSGVKAALMVVDYAMSLIAMKIAGDVQQGKYMADSHQKKLLEDVLVEYLYGKQTQMPLWLTLTFAVAGSYGIIFVGAVQMRNGKKKAQINSAAKPIIPPSPPYPIKPKEPIDTTPYANIKPPVTPTRVAPVMDQSYTVSKDGTAVPSYSDIIETPFKKSLPYSPDPDIIADDPKHVRALISRGIYPMYRRDGKGKVVLIKYDVNGNALIPGKRSKMFSRKAH